MVQQMNLDWRSLLFTVWHVLNELPTLKPVTGVFSLLPMVYVGSKLLLLPESPPRPKGTKHSPSIRAAEQRTMLWVIGILLAIMNVTATSLYIAVCLRVPKEAPGFPKGSNTAALWAISLGAAFVVLILLVLFMRRYGKVNPKS